MFSNWPRSEEEEERRRGGQEDRRKADTEGEGRRAMADEDSLLGLHVCVCVNKLLCMQPSSGAPSHLRCEGVTSPSLHPPPSQPRSNPQVVVVVFMMAVGGSEKNISLQRSWWTNEVSQSIYLSEYTDIIH